MIKSVTAFPNGTLLSTLGEMRCALGRGGIVAEASKREGDGASPAGTYPIRCVHYRYDRIGIPTTVLPTRAILLTDGWCDDPTHPAYNRKITKPFADSHEALWREDHVYDIILELGHNDNPPVAGMGSAIFMHLKHGDYEPTEGCIAVSQEDMTTLLGAFTPDAMVEIALTNPE